MNSVTCQVYPICHDSDFWHYVTFVVTENHDNHIRNHDFCIVGTAKDQTTWHLCYENNPQNGNHVNESNCQIRNHGNCVIGTTVSLETMAIVLNVHPSERNPWQLNYKNVFQTGNHSNSVTE